MSPPVTVPFRLPFVDDGSLSSFVRGAAVRLAERFLRFPALNRIYQWTRERGDEAGFCQKSIDGLGVRVQIGAADLELIPRNGPLVIVCNHPFGGLDGLVLGALLSRVRPDAKLLVNYLLGCIPEFHEIAFFVDPFGTDDAKRRNMASMKAAIRHVRSGGALGVFPSGEVSHYTIGNRCITDPPWSDTVARIVHSTGATVVPIYFEGRNSTLFQILGMIHPRLRTLWLSRELLARRNSTVIAHAGHPISQRKLAQIEEPRRLTDYLRLRTYVLRSRVADRRAAGHAPLEPGPKAVCEPIVAASPTSELEAEIGGLPRAQGLIENAPFGVYYAKAEQIPRVLREIGRLRETTFRAVGEGTGKSIDLDRFDEDYLHFFVWNSEQGHIVGAYRAGQTDEILSRRGASGLYTATLFDFEPQLLQQINPALELGRSFVIAEYQRSYAPLLLLWKGICQYIVQNPRYRRLFGAVSISDDYNSLTKQLLMMYLNDGDRRSRLQELVHPKNPPRFRKFRDCASAPLSTVVRDIDEIEELVQEIEQARRGVPILLRQYLRVNAKLLGFNIDPEFGDVLDGLMLCDVTTMDRVAMNRFFGAEGAASVCAYHGVTPGAGGRQRE
ncbi:MAG: lysophospholipid acyltransferase family protein [Phycisphaerales bacterium]|nr:lysophospholipid acyltransferase family protein [Phycisphaerales bacterium]